MYVLCAVVSVATSFGFGSCQYSGIARVFGAHAKKPQWSPFTGIVKESQFFKI